MRFVIITSQICGLQKMGSPHVPVTSWLQADEQKKKQKKRTEAEAKREGERGRR
jgi:hypothetical protein